MTAPLALLVRAAFVIGAAYLAAAVLMWLFQNRLAFPAPRSSLPQPAAVGFPEGERVELITSDSVTLTGWYLPPNAPAGNERAAPAVLWFTGNAETVDQLGPLMRTLRLGGAGLLAINYRGYGDSGGSTTERGIYRDANAAFQYLASRPEIDSMRIAAYGRSVGSAPALYLAATAPIRAVVLESPFTSARDLARQHYRIFPGFLVRLSLDNLARISEVDAPVLIFHGDRDVVVPFAMGQTLANAAPDARFVPVTGAGHNDILFVAGESYRTEFHGFLQAHLGIENPSND